MRELISNRGLAAATVVGLLTFGCSSSNSSASTPESQTLMQLVPTDFVAKGACGTRLMSYVATLFDVTGPAGLNDAGVSAQRFVVASSPPKSCDQTTVFSDVVSSHAYMAVLHGYEQPPADIQPADIKPAEIAGSSAMVLTSDGSYVVPPWSASCYGWMDRSGNPQPGFAYAYVTMTLSTCTLLGSAQ